jgi:AcrR family transcriptional regulator
VGRGIPRGLTAERRRTGRAVAKYDRLVQAHPRSKTDPRALRTVAKLVDALADLCTRRPDVLPAVDEVARTAGVNRSSFYAHFEDIDDLVSWWIEQELRPVFRQDYDRRSDPARTERDVGRSSLGVVVETIAARRAPLAAMFRGSQSSRLRFATLFIEGMRPNFDAIGERLGWSELQDRVASLFYGAGITSLLISWTIGDLDCDERELLEQCAALIPAELRTIDLSPTRVGERRTLPDEGASAPHRPEE